MIDSQSVARTLRRCAQLAAAAAVLVAISPAAKAQGLFSFFGGPSPDQIENRLEAGGYMLTGPLIRRGDVYLADVQAGRGDFERLVIDPQSGRVIERFRLRPSRWRDGAPGDWGQGQANSWDLPPRPPAGFDRPPPSETLDVPAPRQEPHTPTRDQVARGAEGPKPTVIPGVGGTGATSPSLIKEPKVKPVEAKRNVAAPASVAVTPPATPVVAKPAAANEAPAANPPPAQAVKMDAPAKVMAEKAPPSAEAPTPPAPPKPKALNDLPVTPLD